MSTFRHRAEEILARVPGNYSRRKVLAASGVLAATGGLLLARPRDASAPVDPYFTRMSDALKRAGIAAPTLIIDRARLHSNIDTLMQNLPSGMKYRIVSKSLPSHNLLDEVAGRSGSNRMMVFNLEFLKHLVTRPGTTDILLGKPLPVAAVAGFYKTQQPTANEALNGIQWLVDTPRRIAEYAAVAEARDLKLNLNLEIDVGLHRGGFEGNEDIAEAITMIAANKRLTFSGFMGYEPHLAAVPKVLGLRARATNAAWGLYNDALKTAQEVMGADYNPDLMTRNAAGSPTYRLYQDTSLANEVSVGSALVKPTHFDTDMLEGFQPASFIAAPVIKSMSGIRVPLLGGLNKITELWDPNSRKTIFIYGGHWMADPVSPQGLHYNGLFGRSSNQEMLNGPSEVDLDPNDFVFLRPHQSEAVFLQFGDIAVYDEGEIVDRWPVFPASA